MARTNPSFLAAKRAARTTPGNCSRCGHPNPLAPPHGRGICPACRLKQRAYQNTLRMRRTPTLTPDQKWAQALARRVGALELALENFRRRVRQAYHAGYRTGRATERRHHLPAQWDSWQQSLSAEEASLQFHRVPTEE